MALAVLESSGEGSQREAMGQAGARAWHLILCYAIYLLTLPTLQSIYHKSQVPDLFSTEQYFLAFASCCRVHVTGANADPGWQK